MYLFKERVYMLATVAILALKTFSGDSFDFKYNTIEYSMSNDYRNRYNVFLLPEIKSNLLVKKLTLVGKIACRTKQGVYVDSISLENDVLLLPDEKRNFLISTFQKPGLPSKPDKCMITVSIEDDERKHTNLKLCVGFSLKGGIATKTLKKCGLTLE